MCSSWQQENNNASHLREQRLSTDVDQTWKFRIPRFFAGVYWPFESPDGFPHKGSIMWFPCHGVSMYILPGVVILEGRIVSNQRVATGQCSYHSPGPLLPKEINWHQRMDKKSHPQFHVACNYSSMALSPYFDWCWGKVEQLHHVLITTRKCGSLNPDTEIVEWYALPSTS